MVAMEKFIKQAKLLRQQKVQLEVPYNSRYTDTCHINVEYKQKVLCQGKNCKQKVINEETTCNHMWMAFVQMQPQKGGIFLSLSEILFINKIIYKDTNKDTTNCRHDAFTKKENTSHGMDHISKIKVQFKPHK